MRILALTRYQRLGSSSRVRFYQYFPYLASHGIEIASAPFLDDEYIRKLYSGNSTSFFQILQAYLNRSLTLIRKNDFDLLWVEKEFLPWLPAELEVFLRTRKIPFVVDYDDAVFHRYELNPNFLIRTLLGNKIDKVMHRASLVIAGNEYLAERARQAGAGRAEILPSVVDVNQYVTKQPAQNGIFTIGWIGSPATVQYLSLVKDAITKFSQESPIQLVLVGAGQVNPLASVPTEMLPWSEEIELTVNQKFDVGIMPLVDGPFERGKCGYKLVQYMAGGIPVIASPVGVNQKIVEPLMNGYLANSAEEWLTAFRALRDNPQQRYEMGQAGRKKAEAEYNLQVTAPKLLEMLRSVIHR